MPTMTTTQIADLTGPELLDAQARSLPRVNVPIMEGLDEAPDPSRCYACGAKLTDG